MVIVIKFKFPTGAFFRLHAYFFRGAFGRGARFEKLHAFKQVDYYYLRLPPRNREHLLKMSGMLMKTIKYSGCHKNIMRMNNSCIN